tara:strand:- start:2579 stop:2962 length:384 start_codon:yes stop_codon:yes gene_type:complete
MAFGEHDYEVDQGATFQQSVTYTAKNAAGADIPVNLGTYKARMDVRYANTKEADSVISLGYSNTRATIRDLGYEGIVDLHISASDTANLVPGTYYYDLEVYTGAGNAGFVDRLLQGKFIVSAEVTNV